MNCRLLFAFLAALTSVAAFAPARAQTPTPAAVSIVLPPRLLANSPASLAILGADGHLSPGVAVEIGNGQRIVTDATGRASFTAPPDGAFIATAAGISAASLIDAPPQQSAPPQVLVAPDVSVHDGFALCEANGAFHANAMKDHVTVNGDPAFVLAASPLCLVVLPQARTLAGSAKIEIDAADKPFTAATALVSLDFVPPNPPLLPGRKGRLFVRAGGTADPLRIVVENRSPGVIHFLHGETQELRTSGGAQNEAPIPVQAIRSGSFSFHARILLPPDPASAARYIEIAEGLAPKSAQSQLKAIVSQLNRHPRDSAKPRIVLGRIADTTAPGTLRTLLDAARASL